jgi:CRISPR-associated protein Cas2
MSAAVRDRVWQVLSDWSPHWPESAAVMTWPDSKQPGGQHVVTIGLTPTDLVDYNGVFLARRDYTAEDASRGYGPVQQDDGPAPDGE